MEVEILFSATQAITRRLLERRALIANISIRLIEKRRKKGLGSGRRKALFYLGDRPRFSYWFKPKWKNRSCTRRVKQNEKEPRAPLQSIDDKLLMYLMAGEGEARASSSPPLASTIWKCLVSAKGTFHSVIANCSQKYRASIINHSPCEKKTDKIHYFCTGLLTISVGTKGSKKRFAVSGFCSGGNGLLLMLLPNFPEIRRQWGNIFAAARSDFQCQFFLVARWELGPIIRTSKHALIPRVSMASCLTSM